MRHTTPSSLLAVGILAALIAFLPGCESLQVGEGVERTRQTVHDIRRELDAVEPAVLEAASSWYDVLEQLRATDPDSRVHQELLPVFERLDQTLNELMPHYLRLRDTLRNIDDELQRTQPTGDGVADAIQAGGAVAGAVAPILPPPWNAALMALGPIATAVAGFFAARARREKTISTEIVRAIEAAKGGGDVVNFKAQATTLKAAMSPTTRDRIRKIRGD